MYLGIFVDSMTNWSFDQFVSRDNVSHFNFDKRSLVLVISHFIVIVLPNTTATWLSAIVKFRAMSRWIVLAKYTFFCKYFQISRLIDSLSGGVKWRLKIVVFFYYAHKFVSVLSLSYSSIRINGYDKSSFLSQGGWFWVFLRWKN